MMVTWNKLHVVEHIASYWEGFLTQAETHNGSCCGIIWESADEKDEKFLVFSIKDQKYAFYAEQVKEIAFELGYDDEHYFSRFFKNNAEVSPQMYRDTVGFARGMN